MKYCWFKVVIENVTTDDPSPIYEVKENTDGSLKQMQVYSNDKIFSELKTSNLNLLLSKSTIDSLNKILQYSHHLKLLIFASMEIKSIKGVNLLEI